MKIISIKSKNLIKEVSDTLKAGGLIIYPTETCYGAGVDATNPNAVNKLLKYKDRREGNPISIAVTNKKMASLYAEINETAENIYDNYLPGPITVVSNSTGKVVDKLESEYRTIGIRIPDYPIILDLIENYRHPITATSANVAYMSNPYSIDKLLRDLPNKNKDLIDLIIDAGTLPFRETSTVVDTTLNNMNVLREGRMKFDIPGNQILKAKTKNTEETINFGSLITMKVFEKLIDHCVVLSLGGDLGTGKTHLTKGIGRQLGIKQLIKSPTFNLVNEYKYDLGKIHGNLIHIDTWRLRNEKELLHLKISNFVKKGNIIVIEWADKFFKDLSKHTKKTDVINYRVKFKYIDENTREITLESD